jgi:PAS domain S-box-containing protein
MSRKLLILGLVLIGLHTYGALALGQTVGSAFLGNSLQLVASAIAASMAFLAFRRGRGRSRPFWVLVGLAFVSWCFANVGWMYYENWLKIEVPTPSVVRFLYEVPGIFFAMALVLDEEKAKDFFDLEASLDFVQIAIVFFLVFLGLYYVPMVKGNPAKEDTVLFAVELGEYVAILALALFRRRRVRSQELRRLYGGFALYYRFYTFCWLLGQYGQTLHNLPAGTLYDLAWTVPYLGAAFWAARWQPAAEPEPAITVQQKTIGRLVLTNVILALAPLLALLGVTRLGSEWHLLGSVLLAISIFCYAARLGVTEYRQSRGVETVRRQTLAMDSSVDGMSILDNKGEHIYVNAAFARMMGFESTAAMIGLSWQQVYDPRDVERLENEIRESLAQRGKWAGQALIHRLTGGSIPMEMAITTLPDGGTVCVSRDISERREVEKARAETETKYRMLVEQVAAITYIAELGVNGHWFYVSPQVERILGYTPEEWQGDSQNWIRHVPPEDRPIVVAAEEASRKGEPFQAEYRITRKDGQVVWVSDTAVTVRGSDAHPVMEGIIVDITERKQLETQLQQSRKMEAVGRLAGGIAHDFNNLLTIIKGYTELALNRAASQPELRSDIERIENASERAAALVRQLLAFSRKQVLQPKTLDLNGIVLNLDKLLRRLMDGNIEMVTRVDENLGAVKADPAQIEQVVMNLVVNARDAMPKGGRLVVETANADLDSAYASEHMSVRPGSYVMLAVSDTGVGMSTETVAHIFEPFYTTKESGRGTGLGLSTVYGIVKQSGGYIWVYSEPGRGSSFKVYLPRIDAAAGDASSDKRKLAERRGTETILLVEDEEAVRELSKTVLAGQGYDVRVAKTPAEAEGICKNHPGEIHMLLTDVVMPGMSGRELARHISARRPQIRVLFMSGYTDNVIAQGGMLEEGISFLQKPFTPSVLIHKVREVLSHTPAL